MHLSHAHNFTSHCHFIIFFLHHIRKEKWQMRSFQYHRTGKMKNKLRHLLGFGGESELRLRHVICWHYFVNLICPLPFLFLLFLLVLLRVQKKNNFYLPFLNILQGRSGNGSGIRKTAVIQHLCSTHPAVRLLTASSKLTLSTSACS